MTLQQPDNACVDQRMDSATRSSSSQQSANMTELNDTPPSRATDSTPPNGVTDRTDVISTLPLSEQRTPNSSGGTTKDNSRSSTSTNTTLPNDPATILPGLGKPSSELQ